MSDPERLFTIVEPPTSELVEKAALNARAHTQRIGSGFMKLLLTSDEQQFFYGILKVDFVNYAKSSHRPHSIEGRMILENGLSVPDLFIELPESPDEPVTVRLPDSQMQVSSAGELVDSLGVREIEVTDTGAAEIRHVGTGAEELT